MRILVDGDACPVKQEIAEIAKVHHLEVIIVTSLPHFSAQEYPGQVQVIYVDQGNDAADYRIVRLIEPGDIVVTQDYGLAALALNKQAICLHHTGKEYSTTTIDSLLTTRAINAHKMRSGKRVKGPKAFSKQDRLNFQEQLIMIIERSQHASVTE